MCTVTASKRLRRTRCQYYTVHGNGAVCENVTKPCYCMYMVSKFCRWPVITTISGESSNATRKAKVPSRKRISLASMKWRTSKDRREHTTGYPNVWVAFHNRTSWRVGAYFRRNFTSPKHCTGLYTHPLQTRASSSCIYIYAERNMF